MPAVSPDHTILLRLGRAYHAATQAFEVATGVSAARWRLLYLIACHPGIGQRQLVRLVQVDPGSITRQLSHLETEALIERRSDADDARVLRLHLTRRGRQLVQRVMRIRSDFLSDMVAGVTADELATTLAVLDRVAQNMGDNSPLPQDPPNASKR